MRPIAPRTGVQAAVGHLGQLHREQVVASVDSRTAVDHRTCAGAQPGETITQLTRRLEPPVGTKVLHPRRAHSARDVTGLGIHGLLLAAISLARSGVAQRGVLELPYRAAVGNTAAVWR